MHVGILYNKVAISDPAGDLDVLRQCVVVEEALKNLGHTSCRIACHLNLNLVRDALLSQKPDMVFNLVESLAGTDRLMPVATVLLDSLGIPFTGASSLAILTTTEKLVAKQRMLDHDLSTPAWLTERIGAWRGLNLSAHGPESVIIKAIAEHASLGLGDDSVVDCRELSVNELCQQITARSIRLGTPHFAEQYIDGREFNLSVLSSETGPIVLPPAEIHFIDFPGGKPRIVGQNAKWNEATLEYINTPRCFDFPHSDQALLDELEALARRCWMAFDLRGYARVDFRVDNDGLPWILEINANPCLSSDAGFVAAAQKAGITFDEVVRRILFDAMQNGIAQGG